MIKALRPFWRFEYAVKRAKKVGDPFVGYQKADLKKKLIIAKGKTGCLMLNRFPYAPGHLLVIPYRAIGDITLLTREENIELMDLIVLGKKLLFEVMGPDACNIGLNQGDGEVSGASVPQHAHWHIVPRWKGDHGFFTIIAGGARVLIRSQDNVWVAMRKAYMASLKNPAKGKPSKRKKPLKMRY